MVVIGLSGIFGLGWLAARIDMRAVLAQAKAVPSAYFRGLHALLDDNTEVAVRELTEVARANPKAFELELAVGRLHRRRGENDLAIRLHQRMLDDQELPANQKDRVRLELAEDFLRAGLVDRAEELLLSLEPTPLHKKRGNICWQSINKSVTGHEPLIWHGRCVVRP